ncbi:MAG: ABC transporter ATP-binding protein [Saprospiraceae bacterium]|nr:ABC transporter ATP-binding protein [Saprospiraceae bacterium]MBK7788093.1 ABC transporter ATP-binding protein [Saprospiraceae bacterium]MBK8851947.1 ABC transporter ATP-binding protein [Saprospiraceae bacterium]MBL0082441.1 ABC transporter ATP-binding protein [Saprospiraceae bacterium]HMS98237.1 ABC transporter ATP-binding protein [Saprospiraceae bacterium]
MIKTEPILTANGIEKYFNDPVRVKVLDNICFEIQKGDFVAITGKSGCGKSTLLYILSTLDTDYDGQLWLEGKLTSGKTDKELALIRNQKIGFVFQFHYLLNEFTVLKNVMLPALKLGQKSKEEIEHDAIQNLKLLGMDQKALKNANQLSGGEKQRVAIARALINQPLIIMGDEPTGNLDNKNTDIVYDIFKELSTTFQQTLLIVTHDQEFAAKTHRTLVMEDGRMV